MYMMMQGSQMGALFVAGVVFLLVAVLHTLRIFYKVKVTVSGKKVSMSISWWGLVIALGLSLWMFCASGFFGR